MDNKTHDALWLQLRKVVDALIADSDFKVLDERSLRLLEWIVEIYAPGKPLFVKNVINAPVLGSTATLHKCLKILIKYKMLSISADASDWRRRKIYPTKKTLSTFALFDKNIRSWMQTISVELGLW